MKRVARVLTFLSLLVLAVGLLLFLANKPSNRVIWQSCQPDEVSYNSFDPYCLSVVEGSIDWTTFPFGTQRRYFLFVGRGKEAPAYGVYIDFSFPSAGRDADEFIRASKVEWDERGLTFVTKAGHRLFLPKEAFVGGR